MCYFNAADARTSEESVPEKIFDRGGKLAEAGVQIISYAANSQCSWCLLIGISTQEQGRTIDGNMQLYSVEKKQQQLLEGHGGCFGNVPVTDTEGPAGLFSFAERKAGTLVTKLHIMDVSKPRGEGFPPSFKVATDVAMRIGLASLDSLRSTRFARLALLECVILASQTAPARR